MNKKLKRILKRALEYAQKGYGIASLPFAFLGYATSIYYLAIQNIPFLKAVFPQFRSFLAVAVITIPALCMLIGYAYMKRSWLFRTAREIQIEADPYATEKIPPVNLPMYYVLCELAKKQGIDTSKVEKIIERSRK